MAESTKPSERNNPEPGPAPVGRAEQRSTREQLVGEDRAHDPAVAWERDEQERLPPRGAGAQSNQGRGKPLRPVAETETPAAEAPAPATSEGEQSGGTRGPSNENR